MLAYVEVEAGQLERAEGLLQRVADARKLLLGADHPDTAEAMRGLAYVRQMRSSSPGTERPSGK